MSDAALASSPTSAIGVPDPTDIHVGSRVRAMRHVQKISQTALANAIGITFQQVQKYEKGTNRISCSMIYKIARSLNTPVSYFFEGLPEYGQILSQEEQADRQVCDALMAQRDGPKFAKSFLKMDTHARSAFMELLATVTKSEKTSAA